MNTLQIYKYMLNKSYTKKYFQGCFASNQLP